MAAGAIIGGSIISGAMGMSAASSAADAQTSAANKASQTELEMFYQNRDDMAPWREAGTTALNKLMGTTQYGMEKPTREAIERDYITNFSDLYPTEIYGYQTPENIRKYMAPEIDGLYEKALTEYDNSAYQTGGLLTDGPGEFTKSPGYDFRLKQGEDSVKNYMSASGRSTTGPGYKALMEYGQNFASNEYDKFLDRYYQSLNPYLSMSGSGQVATTNTAQMGQQTANSVAGNQINAGNARASGYINQSNAITGNIQSGMNNYLGYLGTPNYGMNSGGGGTGVLAPGSYNTAVQLK